MPGPLPRNSSVSCCEHIMLSPLYLEADVLPYLTKVSERTYFFEYFLRVLF